MPVRWRVGISYLPLSESSPMSPLGLDDSAVGAINPWTLGAFSEKVATGFPKKMRPNL
jgi:hypothetical protein